MHGTLKNNSVDLLKYVMYHTTLRTGWERFLAQVAKIKKKKKKTKNVQSKPQIRRSDKRVYITT